MPKLTKEYKINYIKDKKDYEKIITKDNVINVIGTKGSGKTSSSLKYINNDEYIVVNCDYLFGLSEDIKNDKEMFKIREMLQKKYGPIDPKENFIKYYNDIINYILSKNKKVFIEGNAIQDINPITLLKGKIIIKRTAVLKSFFRAVKRDYNNKYFMKKEFELHGKKAKITRLYKVIKRRKKIFKEYKEIENKIKELEARKM